MGRVRKADGNDYNCWGWMKGGWYLLYYFSICLQFSIIRSFKNWPECTYNEWMAKYKLRSEQRCLKLFPFPHLGFKVTSHFDHHGFTWPQETVFRFLFDYDSQWSNQKVNIIKLSNTLGNTWASTTIIYTSLTKRTLIILKTKHLRFGVGWVLVCTK